MNLLEIRFNNGARFTRLLKIVLKKKMVSISVPEGIEEEGWESLRGEV